MRHAVAGLPLRRTRTGRGLRHPGLMAFARNALTRIKGLPFRIFMTAAKPKVVMEIPDSYPTTAFLGLRGHAAYLRSCGRNQSHPFGRANSPVVLFSEMHYHIAIISSLRGGCKERAIRCVPPSGSAFVVPRRR